MDKTTNLQKYFPITLFFLLGTSTLFAAVPLVRDDKEILDATLANQERELEQLLQSSPTDLEAIRAKKEAIQQTKQAINTYIDELLKDTLYHIDDNNYHRKNNPYSRVLRPQEKLKSDFYKLSTHSPWAFLMAIKDHYILYNPWHYQRDAKEWRQYTNLYTDIKVKLQEANEYRKWKQQIEDYSAWSTDNFHLRIRIEDTHAGSKPDSTLNLSLESDLYGNVSNVFSFVATAPPDNIKPSIKYLQDAPDNIRSVIANNPQALGVYLQRSPDDKFQALATYFQNAPNNLQPLLNHLERASDNIKRVIANNFRALVDYLQGAPTSSWGIYAYIQRAPNDIKPVINYLQGAPDDIREVLLNNLQQLVTYLQGVPPQLQGPPENIKPSVSYLQRAPNDIKGVLSNNLQKVVVYLEEATPQLQAVPANLSTNPYIAIATSKKVSLYGVEQGTLIYRLDTDHDIHCLAWSPDDKYLAIGTEEEIIIIHQPIQIVNQRRELEIKITHLENASNINSHLFESPRQTKWSPDGKQLGIVTASSSFIFVLKFDQLLSHMEDQGENTYEIEMVDKRNPYLKIMREKPRGTNKPIYQIEWVLHKGDNQPDKYYLATYPLKKRFDDSVNVWNPEEEKCLYRHELNTKVRQLLPDSYVLARFSYRHVVIKKVNLLSDPAPRNQPLIKNTIDEPHKKYYTRDGRYIATSNTYRNLTMNLWHRGKVISKFHLENPLRDVKEINFTSYRDEDKDKIIVIIEGNSKKKKRNNVTPQVRLFSIKSTKKILPVPLQTQNSTKPTDSASDIYALDPPSPKIPVEKNSDLTKHFHHPQVSHISLASDGYLVASYAQKTGKLKVFHTVEEDLRYEAHLPKNPESPHHCTDIALNSQGNQLAIGQIDGRIRLPFMLSKEAHKRDYQYFDWFFPIRKTIAILPNPHPSRHQVSFLTWGKNHLAAFYHQKNSKMYQLVLWSFIKDNGRDNQETQSDDDDNKDDIKRDIDSDTQDDDNKDDIEIDIHSDTNEQTKINGHVVTERKFQKIKKTCWTPNGELLIIEHEQPRKARHQITIVVPNNKGNNFSSLSMYGDKIHILNDQKFIVEHKDHSQVWTYEPVSQRLHLQPDQENDRCLMAHLPHSHYKIKRAKNQLEINSSIPANHFIIPHAPSHQLLFPSNNPFIIFPKKHHIVYYNLERGTDRLPKNLTEVINHFSRIERYRKSALNKLAQLELDEEVIQVAKEIEKVLQCIKEWWSEFQKEHLEPNSQIARNNQLKTAIGTYPKVTEAMWAELELQQSMMGALIEQNQNEGGLQAKGNRIINQLQDNLEDLKRFRKEVNNVRGDLPECREVIEKWELDILKKQVAWLKEHRPLDNLPEERDISQNHAHLLAYWTYIKIRLTIDRDFFSISNLLPHLEADWKDLQGDNQNPREPSTIIEELANPIQYDLWRQNMEPFICPTEPGITSPPISTSPTSFDTYQLEKKIYPLQGKSKSISPETLNQKLRLNKASSHVTDYCQMDNYIYAIREEHRELEIADLHSGSTTHIIRSIQEAHPLILVAAIPEQKKIATIQRTKEQDILLFKSPPHTNQADQDITLLRHDQPIISLQGISNRLIVLDATNTIFWYNFDNQNIQLQGSFKANHGSYTSIRPITTNLLAIERKEYPTNQASEGTTTRGIIHLTQGNQLLIPSSATITLSSDQKKIISSYKKDNDIIIDQWEYDKDYNQAMHIQKKGIKGLPITAQVKDIAWHHPEEDIIYLLTSMENGKENHLIKYNIKTEHLYYFPQKLPQGTQDTIDLLHPHPLASVHTGQQLYFFELSKPEELKDNNFLLPIAATLGIITFVTLVYKYRSPQEGQKQTSTSEKRKHKKKARKNKRNRRKFDI